MIAIGPAGFSQAPTSEAKKAISDSACEMLRLLVTEARGEGASDVKTLKKRVLSKCPDMEDAIDEAIEYWVANC